MVIRSSDGHLCGGSVESKLCQSALVVEAEATSCGLNLALHSNHRKVIMEINSLSLRLVLMVLMVTMPGLFSPSLLKFGVWKLCLIQLSGFGSLAKRKLRLRLF